jgi:thiamine pyrophosphokinase
LAKIALLILGGDSSNKDFQLVGDYEFVCCADSGIDCARSNGIIPHLAVGDFDSASYEGLAWAKSVDCEIITHSPVKDESDGELCLLELKDRGFKIVKIIGAFGKRPDHTLFNLSWLHLEDKLGLKLKYYCEGFEIQTVSGHQELEASPGTLVSIQPFFGQTKIKLSGFVYPYDGVIEPGKTRTLSNITKENPQIEAENKVLLFVELLLA